MDHLHGWLSVQYAMGAANAKAQFLETWNGTQDAGDKMYAALMQKSDCPS
jgi:hypothetical protein